MIEPERSPRSLRRVVGPLVGYHLLLLIGAYFALRGAIEGAEPSLAAGLSLVVLGIALEVALLVWSARLIRAQAAARTSPTGPRARAPPGDERFARFCWRCGWRGPGPIRTCPRCGGVLVAGELPPPGPREPPCKSGGVASGSS